MKVGIQTETDITRQALKNRSTAGFLAFNCAPVFLVCRGLDCTRSATHESDNWYGGYVNFIKHGCLNP